MPPATSRIRLGQIAGLRGDRETARRHFEAALEEEPGCVLSLVGLAGLHEDAGAYAEALAGIEAARLIDPAEPELEVWAARLELRLGRVEGAAGRAAAALALKPESDEAARVLARALHILHGHEGALAWVADRAGADPFTPAWPLAAAALHMGAGDAAAAIAELRTAEALAPASPGVQAELGMALAAMGQGDAAERCLRTALEARPEDLGLRNRLGTILWKAHRIGEAGAELRAALAASGPDPVPLMNLSLLRNLAGDQPEALALADQAVSLTSGSRDALVTRLCVLPYHPSSDAALLRQAAEAVARSFPAPATLPARAAAGRRLRVGLLSGNLCCHPVGWLTIGGVEALPEDRFEVVGYSLRRRDDPIQRRFRARCALWREMRPGDAAGILGRIREDAIDILIDLGGYGEGGCPAVLAARAAPVQVKWVGSQFGTTGLPAMDWIITDRWETPPGFEAFYTERLLRLPDGYVCYSPPVDAPEVGPLPALTQGRVTLGCFNNLAKITDPVLEAWAAVLQRLPGARLVLRTHALGDAAVQDATRARIAHHGIDPGRVEMHGSVPHRQLLEAYNAIDIALDPFPYAGGLTACEALWMGVPVVALHGDGFAARHALSHLSNVGLGDWAVDSIGAYVEQAVGRASHLPELAALRAGLRARVAASPLCDAARFGRALGEALESIWSDAAMRSALSPDGAAPGVARAAA